MLGGGFDDSLFQYHHPLNCCLLQLYAALL